MKCVVCGNEAEFMYFGQSLCKVHFDDKVELVQWRASSGNMTGEGCLGLQQKALADGYIVSVHPDLDYCVVLAGDYWYKIIPGDRYLVVRVE